MDLPTIRKSAKSAEAERDEKGVPYITHDYLVKLCESQGQYSTPQLNDRLYLANRGFRKIEALDAYFNIKALYLNDNIIAKMENLGCLKQLRSLFLQNNHISRIEGLEELSALETLNLSHNSITQIEGLEKLDRLSNLDLSVNKLADACGLERLTANPCLSTINLSTNLISGEEEEVIKALKAFPALRVIYLKQNPIVARIKNYRKRLLFELPGLTYLDDRPVGQHEHRFATSFILHGAAGESAERELVRAEAERSHRNYLADIALSRERGRQKHVAQMKTSKADFERDNQRLDREQAALKAQTEAEEQGRYEQMTLGQWTLEADEQFAAAREARRQQLALLEKERRFNTDQIALMEADIQKSQNMATYIQDEVIERQNYQRPEVQLNDSEEQTAAIVEEQGDSTQGQIEDEAWTVNSTKDTARVDVAEERSVVSGIEKREERLPDFVLAQVEAVLEDTMFDFERAASKLVEERPEYFKAGFNGQQLGQIWAEREREFASSKAHLEELD